MDIASYTLWHLLALKSPCNQYHIGWNLKGCCDLPSARLTVNYCVGTVHCEVILVGSEKYFIIRAAVSGLDKHRFGELQSELNTVCFRNWVELFRQ